MNNEIGLLFIGVDEIDDTISGEKALPKRPISGIKEALIETTENEIKSLIAHIHPKVSYKVFSDMIDGKCYIVIAVEPSVNGPFSTSEKAEKASDIKLKPGRYIRVGRDTRMPNPREEYELLKKFSHFSFSSELNDVATLDDLNYEYIREYLVETNAKSDIREQSKLEMAKSMGLIAESDFGGYRAKNFAVLMFADKPGDFIPNAHVEVIREIKNTDRMESKKFEGPVWLQAKQVSKYFEDNVLTSYTLRNDDAIEHDIIYNYPLTAFEELATNAILHKDYEVPEYVGIYVYKDRISFVNHNRPLPPVSIEALNNDTSFDRRQYLNKELKDMFFALDLIESYGSGIRRAKEALEKNGSPRLIFYPDNEDDDYTNAVMMINPEFLKNTMELFGESDTKKTTKENAEKLPKKVKTTKEKDNTLDIKSKILGIIREDSSVTAKGIADTIGNITADGVRYHLRALKEKGVIKREGSTKKGKWVIIVNGK